MTEEDGEFGGHRTFVERNLSHRGRRSRSLRPKETEALRHKTRSAVVAVTLSALVLTGCDGGPAYFAGARIAHECKEDVAIYISGTDTKQERDLSPRIESVVPLGRQVVRDDALLQPVPDYLYVYVASSRQASYGAPWKIRVEDYASWIDDEGYEVYDINIPPEFCPA